MFRIAGIVVATLATLLVCVVGWNAARTKVEHAAGWARDRLVSIEEDIESTDALINDLEPAIKRAYINMRLNEARVQEARQKVAETKAVVEKARNELKQLVDLAKQTGKKVFTICGRSYTRSDVLNDIDVRARDYEQLRARLEHEKAILQNLEATYANSRTAYQTMKARKQEMARRLETLRTELERLRSANVAANVSDETERLRKVEQALDRVAQRLKKASYESEWNSQVAKGKDAITRARLGGYSVLVEPGVPEDDILARAERLLKLDETTKSETSDNEKTTAAHAENNEVPPKP